MSTKRPAWLPPATASIHGHTTLQEDDALSQASAILALEREGLLAHMNSPFADVPLDRAHGRCRACAALAWARAITGGA